MLTGTVTLVQTLAALARPHAASAVAAVKSTDIMILSNVTRMRTQTKDLVWLT